MNEDNTQEYNEGHLIEAFDRIFNCNEIVDMMLTNHPAIVKFGLEADVDDIVMKLNALYTKLSVLEEDRDNVSDN